MKRKIVALTGGIGSGKSTVAEILRREGYTVLNCDEIARKVEKMPQVLTEIEALLGKGYVVDGQLQRGKIRERIFADNELHKQYSAIFWNKIADELHAELQNAPETVFVEIAVIDAFPFDWTEVWQVESDVNTRIGRVAKRDGVTAESVQDVIARQSGQYVPTRIIPNHGSFDDLQRAVLVTVQAFLDKHLT